MRTAHVGLDPAGTHRIHGDAMRGQLRGEDTSHGVEGSLGDAIGGVTALHLAQGAHATGHVDDAASMAFLQQWQEHLGHLQRREGVRFEGLADCGKAHVQTACVGVGENAGVVHQHVETPELRREMVSQRSDACLIRDGQGLKVHV
jgi:hypothetical protein